MTFKLCGQDQPGCTKTFLRVDGSRGIANTIFPEYPVQEIPTICQKLATLMEKYKALNLAKHWNLIV